ALLLASLSVTYSVFVVGWEKAHRLLLFERAPAMTPDVLAVWCFAAALLLPPSLAAAVTAAAAIGDLPSYNPAGPGRCTDTSTAHLAQCWRRRWRVGSFDINCRWVKPLRAPHRLGC
ncbi:MAG TPA: hypothetical protein VH298_03300, partial [Jatrophihabitans sp.]|nr:hypothetical protein [Jatrophihabitans sp.]